MFMNSKRSLNIYFDCVVESSSAKPPHPRYDISSLDRDISSSDIEQLKINLPRTLTDNLFKKLLDMEDVCVCVCMHVWRMYVCVCVEDVCVCVWRMYVCVHAYVEDVCVCVHACVEDVCVCVCG